MVNFVDISQFTDSGNWECSYRLDSFIETIDDWVKEDGLQLEPDFQRGHVWNEEQQIRFVEFILRGGKIGRTVYFNHPSWLEGDSSDNFVCVDGLQRITAIRRFINNELKVFDKYYYKDFEDKLFAPRMHININNLKTRNEVLKWYIEMNEGGTPHTKCYAAHYFTL